MTIMLYDLCGADRNLRFSPFCWRIKMALRHKDLSFDSIPTRFMEKNRFAFANWELMPVLVDGERAVTNSPDIAEYLEETYPDRPSLFGGPGGVALTRFVDQWVGTVLQSTMFPIVVHDIFLRLAEADQAYFRQTREARLGKTLEQAQLEAPGRLPALHAVWKPLRNLLGKQPFLGGEAPLQADYVVFGALQWGRKVSEADLIGPNPEIAAWLDRLLDMFDGYGRHGI